MKRSTSIFGRFNPRISSSTTGRVTPLRGLGEDQQGSSDPSGCVLKSYGKSDLTAFKECEDAYWRTTAGDCATWEQLAKNRTTTGDEACRATGRTKSDNPCLELVHSCASTVICQIFNYVYAQGQFAQECGEYGPVVAEMFWPMWNQAINIVEGKNPIPCSLRVGAAQQHASEVVLPYWYSSSTGYSKYARLIEFVHKAWDAARQHYALPPAPVCIEPSTLGVVTTLKQIDGPQSTEDGPLTMANCSRWWDNTVSEQVKYKRHCACGRGYNAEHALLAWASQNATIPFKSYGSCSPMTVGGNNAQMCRDSVDYANIQRPADANFGDRNRYPFSLRWSDNATFKRCDTSWHDNIVRTVAMVTGIYMAAMEEALFPVVAACWAQAWKDKQATILSLPELKPGRTTQVLSASPLKFRIVQKIPWYEDKRVANYALVAAAVLAAAVGALVLRSTKRAKPNRRRIRFH